MVTKAVLSKRVFESRYKDQYVEAFFNTLREYEVLDLYYQEFNTEHYLGVHLALYEFLNRVHPEIYLSHGLNWRHSEKDNKFWEKLHEDWLGRYKMIQLLLGKDEPNERVYRPKSPL